MSNSALSHPRTIIYALIPQAAILVGVFLFRSAYIALGLELFLLFAMLGHAHRADWRPRSFRIRRGHPSLLLLPIHLLAGPVLFEIIGADIDLVRMTVRSLGVGNDVWPILLLIHGCVIPIIEEIFWRDLLFSHSTKPVIQDILFACYHVGLLSLLLKIPLLIVSLMVLTASAWLWRRLVASTNSIGVPILLHAAADLSIMSTAFMAGAV